MKNTFLILSIATALFLAPALTASASPALMASAVDSASPALMASAFPAGSEVSPSGNADSFAAPSEVSPSGNAKRSRLAYRGFTGGMMLHAGYLYGNEYQVFQPDSDAGRTVSPSGVPFGIGGAIRFMFGNHLRIGSEGYVSNLKFGEYGSRSKTSWGGLLADGVWSLGKLRFFVGGTVGFGSQTNTVILSPVGDDFTVEDWISYRKFSFMALDPFFGFEIPVSRKLNIVLKADWLLNLTNPQPDFIGGPRLYIGFMFGHGD